MLLYVFLSTNWIIKYVFFSNISWQCNYDTFQLHSIKYLRKEYLYKSAIKSSAPKGAIASNITDGYTCTIYMHKMFGLHCHFYIWIAKNLVTRNIHYAFFCSVNVYIRFCEESVFLLDIYIYMCRFLFFISELQF